jgi:hypothetical protein
LEHGVLRMACGLHVRQLKPLKQRGSAETGFFFSCDDDVEENFMLLCIFATRVSFAVTQAHRSLV